MYFWDQLENETIRNRIQNELLPQAPEVSNAVNEQFRGADHPIISFAQLQFEWETKAWFSHVIWEDSLAAQLPKTQILNEWFRVIKEETKIDHWIVMRNFLGIHQTLKNEYRETGYVSR